MSGEYGVEVRDLSKAYRVYGSPLKRIMEGVSFGRYVGHHPFWALRDVSFNLKHGSAMGLCGANGAGKSTLLKILAGTTSPSSGRFRINGRVASLLELGAGFHDDFTGRANIFLNGIMMGFSRHEVERKIDEIIDFAELGDYIDEPVRTYSSGMGLRLGFSVAVAVDPDVLIIDEVFAVGDMYFQKKCVDKIFDFKNRNKTILFCSHSLYDIRQLCDEALWLNRGDMAAVGDSVSVTNEYTTFQRGHIEEGTGDRATVAFPTEKDGSGRGKHLPRIVDARIYRMGTDEEAYDIQSGDSIELRVWWYNPKPDETKIHLGMGFLRQDTTTIAGMGTHFDGVPVEGERGCLVLKMADLQLLAGQFLVPVILLDEGGVHKYQEFLIPENLVVRAHTREVGLLRIPHEWQLRPELADSPPSKEPAPSGADGGVART